MHSGMWKGQAWCLEGRRHGEAWAGESGTEYTERLTGNIKSLDIILSVTERRVGFQAGQ